MTDLEKATLRLFKEIRGNYGKIYEEDYLYEEEMYESFPGFMADELISWYKNVTPIIKEIERDKKIKELLDEK